jgi:hypothetical protein
MGNPEHRRAWEILQGVSEGQKNLFLVRAILHEQDREYLEQAVRKAVREELKGRRIEGGGMDGDRNRMSVSERQEPVGRVPEQVLDFISMLQEE